MPRTLRRLPFSISQFGRAEREHFQFAWVDASPSGEAISPLDGLAEDAIETLDEGGWVFEWDAFEKEGLVEE
jgi:hypothetical protein